MYLENEVIERKDIAQLLEIGFRIKEDKDLEVGVEQRVCEDFQYFLREVLGEEFVNSNGFQYLRRKDSVILTELIFLRFADSMFYRDFEFHMHEGLCTIAEKYDNYLKAKKEINRQISNHKEEISVLESKRGDLDVNWIECN